MKKLGKLITVYRDRPLVWRDIGCTFIPAILAALTPFFYGLWRGGYAMVFFGPAATRSWSAPWFTLSAVALIPLLGLALSRLRRARRVVKVFAHGLSIQGRGGKRLVLFWRDIGGISESTVEGRFLGFSTGLRHRAKLYPAIGKPVGLDPRLPNVVELCARIKGKIYPRLLPELRKMLKNKNNLYFGPITLNNQGIRYRGEAYTWKDISFIQIQKGVVKLELVDQPIKKIPVGEIPNIELLIQLIQEGVAA